jgi:hypothetical protein
MASFPPDVLDQLRETREIEIETTRRNGETSRAIIWVEVDGDDVFVRSEYGDEGWWYQHLRARPDAVVHIRGRKAPPIPVRAVVADDPESIERCSEAIRAKYRPSSSVKAMTKAEILHATVRLDPA